MKSWISIILAVIFLSAVLVFNIRQPQPLPVPAKPTPTALPSATPLPTILSNSCSVASLSGTLTLEGAAGNIYATAKLTNISRTSCSVTISKNLTLIYPQTIKNISVVYPSPLAAKTYMLEPKASLSALIHMPNGPQCAGPVTPVKASLTYMLPDGQTITFKNLAKDTFTIQACSTADITKIDISSLSAQIKTP